MMIELPKDHIAIHLDRLRDKVRPGIIKKIVYKDRFNAIKIRLLRSFTDVNQLLLPLALHVPL